MSIMKKYSPKRLIMAAIVALIALINLLTPVFQVVGISGGIGSLSLNWSVNGYQIAFGSAGDVFSEIYFRDSYVWYMISNWIHIIAAVAVIVFLVFTFIKKAQDFEKISFISVITCGVFAVIYCINGIVAMNTVGDRAGTAAFVPLILLALLAVGYVAVDKLLDKSFGKK